MLNILCKKKEKGISLRCFYTVPDSLCHCHLAWCRDHAMAHATVPARESFCTSEDHTSQPHSTTTSAGMGSPIHTVAQDTMCHQNVCGYPMLTTDLCQGRHGGMPYWWNLKTSGVISSVIVIACTSQVVGVWFSFAGMNVSLLMLPCTLLQF